jgi:hypothetical protein
VREKEEKDFLATYPQLPPQERVRTWLVKSGGLLGYATELENELIVNGLDTVPFLAEIVYKGKGDFRLAALNLLCRMDRFVPVENLPKGVPESGWIRLSGKNSSTGRLDQFMVVDGRRIGKAGVEAIKWAAEQTQHDDLRFHAREYSGLMERDLRRLSLDEQVGQWRKASAKCKDAIGMNDDCTVASKLGNTLSEKPDEAIPLLIEILEHDANPYVREDALGVLVRIDSTSMRLRGTTAGRNAIEATRRALSRCNLKPSFDERESCQQHWAMLSAEFFDDRLENYMSDWLQGLESLYGLRLKEEGNQARTAEAQRFIAYLTGVDPYFPSWEFTTHGDWADSALHPRFQAKWERYYEQWKRFKAESDKAKGQR